jgi:hypothetical protein
MHYHVSWHRAPAILEPGLVWQGPLDRPLPTVQVASAALFTPWDISFEAAIAALEAIPQMFCEWDGAWVWHPARGRQVEGVNFDRVGRLAYVELKGNCLGGDIDLLAAALNPSAHLLLVQLPREGVVLPWQDWRESQFQQQVD